MNESNTADTSPSPETLYAIVYMLAGAIDDLTIENADLRSRIDDLEQDAKVPD